MKYAIFDLDGCISDDRWRIHLLPPTHSIKSESDFDAYHELSERDEFVNSDVLEAVAEDHHLLFVTARPEKWRRQTLDWIDLNIPPKTKRTLLMRPKDDMTPSAALKAAMIYAWNGPNAWKSIALAYDDRLDVIQMYRDRGVRAIQLEVPPMPFETAPTGDVLRSMAETFDERNKVYGDNYKMVGKIMAVLFPEGVTPAILHSDHFHMFELKIVKLTRFAISNLTHVDSIHDDAVYSAMIESILTEQNKDTKNEM